jgi:hypothetical protein
MPYNTLIHTETLMNDLIEALQIFAKYGNPDYPTHCEHDTLMIMGICPEDVSGKIKRNLMNLVSL